MDIISLNEQWSFLKAAEHTYPPFRKMGQPVRLPHSWNVDAGKDYERCCCLYTRSLELEEKLKGKRLYLEFQGANSVCTVYLNDILVGSHRGGYCTFRFDITDLYDWSKNENLLSVLVDNSHQEDISPLLGDFTIYGGLYRDVNLLAAPEAHFDYLYYGTMGILLYPRVKSAEMAEVCIEPHIVNGEGAEVLYEIYDPNGNLLISQKGKADGKRVLIEVESPVLWNGTTNPALYKFAGTIISDQGLDKVEMEFGFRDYEVTLDGGMYLNGKPYPLRGVATHQDRQGRGNATTKEDREEDFDLIQEMGANAVRLSHYQHAPYVYDLCDKQGLVVWAEIPMLYMTEDQKLLDNACIQLKELILQNIHHPSICFWGIQNEIAMLGEEPFMYEKTGVLHELAKELDPTRMTVCANLHSVKADSKLNQITDAVGYNAYYGWYYGEMEEFRDFLDTYYQNPSATPLGISEYGVDANLDFHSSSPKRKDYSEEFQSLYHETVYGIFESYPQLWSTFVWNMFDFGSAIRDEGGTKARNAKGLVSFDRKIKKDAFYFYKSCWSKEPFLHITGRRYLNRCESVTNIKVYSNLNEVSLAINGRLFESKTGKRVFEFVGVPLENEWNRIEAKSGQYVDTIDIHKVQSPDTGYIFEDPNPGFNVTNWFLRDEEEIFPKTSYSLQDTIGELMQNEEAWTIIKETLPGLWADPFFEKRKHYSLFKIVNRMSGKFNEETVKDVNRRLTLISKVNNE